jgi:putative component of membrane protein insertase Oxa1/YidC/SpoIIIJ protein YidD
MKKIALVLIRLYQRFISPYKGFACAYRVHTGCASCSALGYRAIRRFGLVQGIAVLRMRFHRCGVAYRRFAAIAMPRSKQAGFCEILECGGALATSAPDLACMACEVADWVGSKKKEDESKVHLPPGGKVDSGEPTHPTEGGWGD